MKWKAVRIFWKLLAIGMLQQEENTVDLFADSNNNQQNDDGGWVAF